MFARKESWWSLNGKDYKIDSSNDLELGQGDSEASSRTEGYYTPPEDEPKIAYLGNNEHSDEPTQGQLFQLSNVSLSQEKNVFSSEKNSDAETNLEQLKQLGNYFFTQGDYAAAINCYDTILESTPKKLSVLANRAMCYLKLENFDKAIQDSESCIETNPIWPKGYYIKGIALLHKGDAEMAASCFGHGLEFCPSDRKLIEGKRKAMHSQIGGNSSEPLESTKGSAFPLSKSVTSNNEESQNFNFTGSVEWKDTGQQNVNATEFEASQLDRISDRMEHEEAQRRNPDDRLTQNNNIGKVESLLSVQTEASRILHAPNFYSVLRVPISCTREEVEQNYKMLSHILSSFEPKGENVEAANQVLETAHDVLSSTIKRRLYQRFLMDKKKKKKRNADPSSIQNHLEMTESGQNFRWQIDETEVPLPKFLDYILRIRNIGWFLLLLLFLLFLPLIIVLVLVGMILWFLLSPIVTVIRTCVISLFQVNKVYKRQLNCSICHLARNIMSFATIVVGRRHPFCLRRQLNEFEFSPRAEQVLSRYWIDPRALKKLDRWTKKSPS
ncbi:Hsp70-Hsp90 organizing protein [Galdieria sulphuraria]|nr:Hsp70-Hsp90 organizing protein [Galdieria sulphuraria]